MTVQSLRVQCGNVTVITNPLLAVVVLQVIGGPIIPVEPNAHQPGGQETIFSHDHKVGKESSQSLNHPYTVQGKENASSVQMSTPVHRLLTIPTEPRTGPSSHPIS